MAATDLAALAQSLVAPGKGILAADESSGTIEKRFKSIHVASNEDSRRTYRELLFTTAGAEEFISGVILYDETIRQKTREGRPFAEVLAAKGIRPGIKVDTGARDLAAFPGEKITEGLDGLRERLAEYAQLGARFTKWRAVITIGGDIPSEFCISTNAGALARYAALSQEAGLVPIVEPEVLMDGDHTLERCETVTQHTLERVYAALHEHKVQLEGTLLKPNMVLSGKHCPIQVGIEEVAASTVRCLRRTVPTAVPGIVFLSGGQSDVAATAHLSAMNRLGPHPWQLSFSYGRALQAPALEAWAGQMSNTVVAQKAYYHRARMNGAARFGRYSPSLELE